MREAEKIYISGPVTGTNDYAKRFRRAERMLARKGYEKFNPVEEVAKKFTQSDPWSEIMKWCLIKMDECDGVLFLKDWDHSRGAVMEFEKAYKNRMTIYFEEDSDYE